ncbi:MAG: biotin/lipoyl-binding protein, partial [Flavobacteriales bacterium]|nr:biotin/lipoyl-binding protein [Flavobacteriales bacterium]
MKKSIYTLSIVLVSIALISSCGEEKEETPIAAKSMAVQVATPLLQTGNSLMISGKVEAISNATLSTRQMGFVDEIHVNIGEKVNKGQLLLSITNEDLRAKKAQVEAKISEALAVL